MPTLRVADGVGQVLKDMVEWQNPPCNRPSPLSGIIDVFLVPVTFRKTSVACNRPHPSRYSSSSRSVSPSLPCQPLDRPRSFLPQDVCTYCPLGSEPLCLLFAWPVLAHPWVSHGSHIKASLPLLHSLSTL